MRDSKKSSPAKKSGRELAETAKAMLKQGGKKVLVKTVDCTPDWIGLAPLFIEWIQSGNSEQHMTASENIYQMAKISDAYRKNIPLLQASTDMLEALKLAHNIIKQLPDSYSYEEAKIRKAIARATGKQ